MGILTGDEIIRQLRAGRIVIDPFDDAAVGPNSVDLTLGDRLLAYDEHTPLDMRQNPPEFPLWIPPDGVWLRPGRLYLAATNERCGSDCYVACIEGRSSVGRLGVSVHCAAGFGDIGFKDAWTLEITVAVPVRVYAGVRICQAYFFEPAGDITRRYRGKYAAQNGPAPSRLWQDFKTNDRDGK